MEVVEKLQVVVEKEGEAGVEEKTVWILKCVGQQGEKIRKVTMEFEDEPEYKVNDQFSLKVTAKQAKLKGEDESEQPKE